MEELRKLRLVKPQSMHGDIWDMTAEGYKAAEMFLAEEPEKLANTVSKEAQDILVHAADGNKNPQGGIFSIQNSGGYRAGHIFVSFGEPDSAKRIAIFKGAIGELHRRGFIKNDDLSGTSYTITREGYEMAEKLM